MPARRGADGRFLPKGSSGEGADDTGWRVSPEQLMKDLDDLDAEIGFFDPENALKAAVNEYGSDAQNIPSRPFLSTAFDNNKDKYQAVIKKTVGRMIDNGRVTEDAFLPAALEMRTDIILNIRQGMWVPNRGSTVIKKKSSRPLVDTGEMQRSIQISISGKIIK